MAITITENETFVNPKGINDVLQSDDFYRLIIELSPSRSLDNLTDYKLSKFKDNYLPKITVFLNGFFKVNNRIQQLKTLSKIQSYKFEVSSYMMKLLFHSDYYKAILEALKKYNILNVQRGYSTHSHKYTENYMSHKLAVKLAIENGENPKKANGSCKRYHLDDYVLESANQQDGLVELELQFTEAQLKTINNFFGSIQNDDHFMNDYVKIMSDKIVLDQDIEPTNNKAEDSLPEETDEVDKTTIYDRLKAGNTRVKRKSKLNWRLTTDHANCERDHLKHLKTTDGRTIKSLDISNAMPSYTIMELKKGIDSNIKGYDSLFEAVSTGQVYELLQEIVEKHTERKYSRGDMKKNFRYVMYMKSKDLFSGSIALHIHDAMKKEFPLWLDKIQYLNSKESFVHTFGIGALQDNRRNSMKKGRKGDPQNYIFFHYAFWETEYIYQVYKEVIHAMGRIPLASRYDSVVVAENDARSVLKAMNTVSSEIHEIPIKIHEEDIKS